MPDLFRHPQIGHQKWRSGTGPGIPFILEAVWLVNFNSHSFCEITRG